MAFEVPTYLATYLNGITGTELSEVQEALAGVGYIANVQAYPYLATGNGATDALAAFQSFDDSDDQIKLIPSGDYYLSAEWKPPAQDIVLIAAGDVEFSNNHPDFENLIPFQSGPGPIWSQLLVSKTYGAAWAGQGNVFQIGSYVDAAVATVPVVAVFGQGRASAASSKAWGGNFVAYADHATGTAIGIELNIGVLTAGGTANGLVIASAGSGGQPLTAIQIQSNNASGQFVDGIKFNWRATEGLLTGNVFTVAGDTGATCARLIRATSITCTSAEIDIPSFIVAATPATVDARIAVTASTGTTARIGVNAVSADATVQIRPKGTGQAQLADSSGNVKVAANSTGIGFNGTTPIAKPAPTGSRGGNAALASLLTELANLGLITDSTSA